jgi:hypothetical protein
VLSALNLACDTMHVKHYSTFKHPKETYRYEANRRFTAN